jgi:hypothetical protein
MVSFLSTEELTMRRWIVLLLLPFCFTVLAADHQTNRLYQKLIQSGLMLGTANVPLPAPYMADGLSAADQRAVIEKLPGRNQEVDEMLRLSPVAPFAVKFHDIPSSNSREPGRRIDLAFVTPGSLEKLAKTDVLDRLLNSGRTDASITPLSETKTGNEGQAHVSLPLMDKVILDGTMQTMWTRSNQSLILAGHIDPRFNNDAKYQNRWRLLQRDADGKLQPQAKSHPYEAVAYYFKFTPLVEVKDALFVEAHLLFAEPADWFDGANLLRSKLPIVLQTKIRAFRRDLMR